MSDGLPPDWDSQISEAIGEESDRAQVVAGMLLKESDRGCAIFGAAILHDNLELLFRSFCRKDKRSIKRVVSPLFQGYAPLATFSARIQLAYAMQLISNDLYHNLEIVRRLRNDFAHESGPLDFQDPRCQDRLRLLTAGGAPYDASDDDNQEMNFGTQMLTKRQFVDRLAFVLVISEITGRMRYITEQIDKGFDVHALVAALDEGGK